MNYCTACNINLGTVEIENNKCPKCATTIRTITNTKLINILTELNETMYKVSKGITKNPKDIIELAKIIQKGEKKLANEYKKKMELMQDLDYELSVITKFAQQMNYNIEE